MLDFELALLRVERALFFLFRNHGAAAMHDLMR